MAFRHPRGSAEVKNHDVEVIPQMYNESRDRWELKVKQNVCTGGSLCLLLTKPLCLLKEHCTEPVRGRALLTLQHTWLPAGKSDFPAVFRSLVLFQVLLFLIFRHVNLGMLPPSGGISKRTNPSTFILFKTSICSCSRHTQKDRGT